MNERFRFLKYELSIKSFVTSYICADQFNFLTQRERILIGSINCPVQSDPDFNTAYKKLNFASKNQQFLNFNSYLKIKFSKNVVFFVPSYLKNTPLQSVGFARLCSTGVVILRQNEKIVIVVEKIVGHQYLQIMRGQSPTVWLLLLEVMTL